MMNDKNNKELKTGQIVKIEGSFFKSGNGIYLIEKSPNDPDWSGNDYCLKKCNKDGVLSNSKNSTSFWPLMVTVSNREKKAEAREHNKRNATIEVIGEVKTYNLTVKQIIGWDNEYTHQEIATEQRYNELLSFKNCEVSIN